jgi:GDP-D-mannose dehydratase
VISNANESPFIVYFHFESQQTHVSLFLHYGDLSDSTNLFHIISTVKPHEIYNLGAMSHVAVRQTRTACNSFTRIT